MGRSRILLVSIALLAARAAGATTAADIPCLASSPAPMPCVVDTTVAVDPASTLDFGTRGLTITSRGQLDAGGGDLTIIGASLLVQSGGVISTRGGSIDITTTGDTQIDLRGRVDVSGDSGGFITTTAAGNLTIAGNVVATGLLSSGDGGSIDVTGTNVNISGRLGATGGSTGFGGDISASGVVSSVTISGTLDVSAGDGGTISVDADADVTVTAGALLDGNAGAAGSGDSIDITSYSGNVTLAGTIRAHAPGGNTNGGGSGADLCVDASGAITNDASIDMSGGGQGALGGSAEFTTDGDITQRGSIDVSASGSGGYAGLVSFTTTLGTVNLSGSNIDAIGPGAGGDISAFSYEDVRVSNRITADGPNSSIDIQGCSVDVLSTGRLSSVGVGGDNAAHASGQMTIAGTLLADTSLHCSNDNQIACGSNADCHFCQTDHTHLCAGPGDCGGALCDTAGVCTSGNTLEYRSPTMPPILMGAVITPAAVQVLNPALVQCGGPPTTTTSTTTSTTSPSTTATTTTVVTTSITTMTIPAATTTTTVAATTTSTTTSTTTAPAPSTSTSTAPPPSTTTTTTLQASSVCDPPDCQDGNACTDDTCGADGMCVHHDRAGFDAVTCRLETIVNVLATAPVTEVGGPATRGRFQAALGKIQRMVDAGRNASGKRQITKLRRANKLITTFIHTVEKGEHRGKVKDGVGKQMTDLASGAQSSLQPYIF